MDGLWIIKRIPEEGKPWLLLNTIGFSRDAAIAEYKEKFLFDSGGCKNCQWETERKAGLVRCVKVRLIETLA